LLRIGDVEDVEDERNGVSEAATQLQQSTPDLPAAHVGRVVHVDVEERAQNLEDWEPRDGRCVRRAMRLRQHGAARATLAREVETEPRSADARLTDDREDLAVPRGRLVERMLQDAELVTPTDEPGSAAR